ncbi:MAG: tRNA (guanine-N(7)-)-methyltransferase [Haliscomenobacter sp.]|jgi:tRNA (guanine-N7-)-methyltransferase|nr:tRNA (guanine-N(7)-)-methyltransferase [Haliscomenobacter sp.]
MSRRNKLQKFAEILQFPNVYENYETKNPELVGAEGKPADLKGRWAEAHFGNAFPITLELACGRGEYSLGLGRLYPQRNFIGVDVKGARIWRGAKTALEERLSNVAFLRTRIELIEVFFAPQEIQEIWITFPDPFPQNGKANRRLTASRFLDRYRRLLAPGGLVHLKTDDPGLFAYSVETVAATPGARIHVQEDGIYSLDALPLPELEIKTFYERMHLSSGKTIKYLQFSL